MRKFLVGSGLCACVASFLNGGCSGEEPAFRFVGVPDSASEVSFEGQPGDEWDVGRRSSDVTAASMRDEDAIPDPGPLFSDIDGHEDLSDPGLSSDGTPQSASRTDGASSDGRNFWHGDEDSLTDFSDQADGGFTPSIANTGDDAGQSSNTGDSAGSGTLTKSFRIKSESLVEGRFAVTDGWISQPIELREKVEVETWSERQINRAQHMRIFTQGSGGETVIETLNQEAVSGVLDLLVVIDNSGSMGDEQKNLASKLGPLLSYVDGSDWKIGVVTTDPSEGCMRAVIEKGTPTAVEDFAAAIGDAGLRGSGNERGILMSVAGLGCEANPWVRPDSTVAVLIVSDEDNCSDGTACPGDPWNTEDFLIDYMSREMGREVGIDARIYGLFRHPDDHSCTSAYNVGYQYASAVEKTSGAWGSICSSDYSTTLQAISSDVSGLLKDQFVLKTQPIPGTERITILLADGSEVPAAHYTINGKVVTFSIAPPAGSVIEVTYETAPEIQLREFDLGLAPAAGSVAVSIDDVPVGESSFQVPGSILSFLSSPPAESRIRVTFRDPFPGLKTSFDIGRGVLDETLQVFLNGAELSKSDFVYLRESGTLKFSSPPPDNTLIEAAYQKSTGPELRYALMTPEEAMTDIRAQYADGTRIAIETADGSVRLLDSAQHRPGEIMWVQHRVADQGVFRHQLAHLPLPGSLQLTSDLEDCRVGQEIRAAGQEIQVDCEFAGEFSGNGTYLAAELWVNYSYLFASELPRSFTFDGLTAENTGSWEVWVDGNPLSSDEFLSRGNEIILAPDVQLEHGSEVLLKHIAQMM